MNHNDIKNPYFLIFALLLVGLLGLCVYFHMIDMDRAVATLHEGGLIETLSALGYITCLGIMIIMGRLTYVKAHYPLMLIIVLFDLRELDFDKRFTETGLLQSRIFTSADVILTERIIGLLVMALIIGLIIYIVRYYVFAWVSRLIRLDMVAVGVALAMVFMVVSKSIDGLGRKLEPLGIMVNEQAAFTAAVFEEVFELGIPILLIIITVGYFQQSADTHQSSELRHL